MKQWTGAHTAEQWRRTAEARNRYLAGATEAMFELARGAPSARVLDLGTGGADVALMAAARVGPQGRVVAIDASEDMVDIARTAVRDADASNVTVALMDAQALELPDASFDAVVGRMVLMFASDLARVLSGVRRVLTQNGRFAATTWSTLANNPFQHALIDVARSFGPLPDPAPEIAQAFSLSDAPTLVRALEAAGFRDVEVRVVRDERTVPNVAEEVARHKTWQPVAGLFAGLDEASRARAWSEVERRWRAFDRGGVASFPSEALVVGASR